MLICTKWSHGSLYAIASLKPFICFHNKKNERKTETYRWKMQILEDAFKTFSSTQKKTVWQMT